MFSTKVEDATTSPLTHDRKTSVQDSDDPTIRLEPPPPVRNISGIRWALSVSAVYVAALLYGLDTTIVADVQVPIIKAFGHVDQLTWIGAGFPLGSVAVILPVGILYDLFNVKWVYIISQILFEVGSALCGASPNMNA